MGHKRLTGEEKGSTLAVALISLLILLSAVIMVDLYRRGQPQGLDFAPLWAAANLPSEAYDVQAITSLQSRIFGIDLVPRPYAYPPTTLLFLLPFGWFSFWYAYVAFVAIGSILFVLALRSSSASLWAFAFPPIFILLHVGQLSLLAGSLLLLALTSSNWAFRGTLFAVATALKPQLALFLPLLLVLQRDWRSVALAFPLFCFLVAASVGAFGLDLWKDWGQSLRDLVQVVKANPTLAAHQISGSRIFLPVSLIAVWVARKADAATQLALIVGAALLVSPYAMNYELGLLVPALARSGFEKDKPTAAVALIFATWSILFFLPVLLITLGFLIWRTWAGDAADARNTPTLSGTRSGLLK